MMLRDTSEDAALHGNKHILRKRVFQALIDHRQGGMTCDELEQELELTHQSCSPRLTELHEIGRIFDSGARRRTRSGCNAIVWLPTAGWEDYA